MKLIDRPAWLFICSLFAVALLTGHAFSQDAAPDPASTEAAKQLEPLFRQIRSADSTRATVDLAAETIIDGAVVGSEKSVYQIASKAPDQFTVYLKDTKQRSRIFCDGQQTVIAFSAAAYTDAMKPIKMQDAVFGLPIALGPYPEAVFSLTLAGVDPTLTWTSGMKSIRLVGKESFRGEIPAWHFEGLQDDLVRWNLWMTRDPKPKPLRLRVDLTEMLRQNGSLDLPSGYRYMLRFDFKYWSVDQPASAALFQFRKPKDAERFDSVEAY
ncbi:MAG: DUF2092 domain-containing protein, partial [Planctomycetota bacterium]